MLHCDIDAARSSNRGEFEPDETGADNDDALDIREAGTEIFSIAGRAQLDDSLR